jgi:hypothetical protein
VKVLTLHQPWASLVALGVKTIETRSWSTSYRGPLAIHAGRRWEPVVLDPEGDCPWCASDRGFASPVLDHWDTTEQRFVTYRLALGAIVATCMLVDVAPIGDTADDGDAFPRLVVIPKRPPLFRSTAPYPSLVYFDDPMEEGRDVSSEEPYGDFTPGRFAWLLTDIQPLPEPVPFKGGQGLTKEWEAA